jgi:hypothetical protein
MRGREISPEQVEVLKATYAETGSVTQAAEAAGVGKATASKYVRSDDEFERLRTEKRLDIIDEIARVRLLYIEHLAEDAVVGATDARDAATVLGILTDKHQLLTGRATERREQVNVDSAREQLKDRIEGIARRGLKVV